MPVVWRLTPTDFAHLLDGEGSRFAGGRWNSPGKAVLYTSSHLSLSVLEALVHLPPPLRRDLPEMEAVRIAVPDDAIAEDISIDRFRRLMAGSEPLAVCRAAGDAWLERGTALLLRAPSVVVSEELNLMINPAHGRMREVRIVSSRRFSFDPRMAHPA
ncbi:MAG: RES family NAD+ phosphorylase [Propylenella sp.]